MSNPELLSLPKENDRPYTLEEWLALRGFRKASIIDRLILDRCYSPPFLQPGGIAPRENTGDPEVRQRVLEKRRQALWQAMGLSEV